MISLSNITLEHHTAAGTVVALNDISLRIDSGEYVALLGASGSGKTTLLNVIGGLVLPTAGDVEVANRELSVLSESERARLRLHEIGIVFQDNNLIAEFTASENVALPLRARGWGPREAEAAASQLLSEFGLDGLERRRPVELSGGQKQRVGIARGLAGGRQILLADEPTGALDSVSSRSVFELLQNIAGQGVAVIVATHDPIIMNYASRVISIRDGSIMEDTVRVARS
ncbi:ABC transporter ATP-binding protein [Glaciihabitans arcticus]|uniref:ABC transporter ATP-binding protein n=1 Tax=Glaciihabitans arcticus TaxID=2668039 RepID=UPI0013870AB8|nr:ABC transporter ATP-binding protein [Glaciihabitans arcticus]